jgi:osmotically-inducible protein OsmY
MDSPNNEVLARVLNALHWDLAIPRDRLRIDVENGWVTVSGRVDMPYQRACAESDARNVAGVVGVTNLISVADAPGESNPPRIIAQIQH